MNINESLITKVKQLREAAEDYDKPSIFNVDDSELDAYELEDTNNLYTDFGDTPVESGESFEADGMFFEWDKPFSDIINNRQVWSATEDDYSSNVYFVVDLDSAEILYGPVDTVEAAKDFLTGSSLDDADNEDDYSDDDYDDAGFSEALQEDYVPAITMDTITSPMSGLDNFMKALGLGGSAEPVEMTMTVDLLPEDRGNIADAAANVMAAYLNANKWLDSVKEITYFRLGCPVLANYIHNLAHKFPSEFDSFGTILHTANIEIPYPATEELQGGPVNIIESIESTISILDSIKLALNDFINVTDDSYHGMACATEDLLNNIEAEYPMLFRLLDNAKKCNGDTLSFEKYVCTLVEHKDELLD